MGGKKNAEMTADEIYLVQNLNGRKRNGQHPILGDKLATLRLWLENDRRLRNEEVMRLFARSDFGQRLSLKPFVDNKDERHGPLEVTCSFRDMRGVRISAHAMNCRINPGRRLPDGSVNDFSGRFELFMPTLVIAGSTIDNLRQTFLGDPKSTRLMSGDLEALAGTLGRIGGSFNRVGMRMPQRVDDWSPDISTRNKLGYWRNRGY